MDYGRTEFRLRAEFRNGAFLRFDMLFRRRRFVSVENRWPSLVGTAVMTLFIGGRCKPCAVFGRRGLIPIACHCRQSLFTFELRIVGGLLAVVRSKRQHRRGFPLRFEVGSEWRTKGPLRSTTCGYRRRERLRRLGRRCPSVIGIYSQWGALCDKLG